MLLSFDAAELSDNQVEITVHLPSGSTKQSKFDCTIQQIADAQSEYNSGKLVQDAFWFLSADDREFLMTGLTPEEWDAMFPDEE